jgi:hypothetical protein
MRLLENISENFYQCWLFHAFCQVISAMFLPLFACHAVLSTFFSSLLILKWLNLTSPQVDLIKYDLTIHSVSPLTHAYSSLSVSLLFPLSSPPSLLSLDLLSPHPHSIPYPSTSHYVPCLVSLNLSLLTPSPCLSSLFLDLSSPISLAVSCPVSPLPLPTITSLASAHKNAFDTLMHVSITMHSQCLYVQHHP